MMTVEITSVTLAQAVVTITAIDVSEEYLAWMERTRHDEEREVVFVFDTRDPGTYAYLRRWLLGQKAARGCSTWGEALQAVRGRVTELSGRYREFD